MRVATDVFKSAIKSRRRFTYEEVDEYLAAKSSRQRKSPSARRRLTPRACFAISRRKSTRC